MPQGVISFQVKSTWPSATALVAVRLARPMPISVMSNCNTCARRKGLLQMNTKEDINRLIETLEGFRGSVSPHVRQSLSYARTCYN